MQLLHPRLLSSVLVLGALFVGAWAFANHGGASGRYLPYTGNITQDGATVGAGASVDLPMVFRFYDASAGGTLLDEISTDVSVTAGKFSVDIGPLTDATFDAAPLYLEVEVDGAILGRQLIAAAPYAVRGEVGKPFVVDSLLTSNISGGNSAGNVHIDSDKSGADGRLYLNYFDGKGVAFGNGSNAVVGSIDTAGNLSATGNVGAGGNVSATGKMLPSAGSGGIEFPPNAFGGGGDTAWMRLVGEGGENTQLQIGVANDADDDIAFYQSGGVPMRIQGGKVGINGYIELAVNSCNQASCTATCPSGSTIVSAFGFHGAYHSADVASQWTCGAAIEYMGSCLGGTSCTVSSGCGTSGMQMLCRRAP
jgi:hypothetical protein